MAGQMTPSALVAHLYRRAGFGATAAERQAAASAGYGATVDALLAGLPGPDPGADRLAVPPMTAPPAAFAAGKPDPAAQRALSATLHREGVALGAWWLGRMLATTNPLREKLTFLLHGQFPTAVSKVRFPLYMYRQNQVFRTLGAGDFATLTQAVATDPAMLIWLDAGTDKKAHPNENFARELMERFTMGFGNYGEPDVRAAAICFTGWRLDRATGTFVLDARQHDPTPQTFLGHTGVNSGRQVVDIVTRTDASAHFVPARFWSHLAYPVTPGDPVVADLAPGYATDRNVGSLLRAIFTHPAFVSSAATTGLVKQPVEWMVGALRALGIGASTVMADPGPILTTLAQLGQVPFDPPSVGGWPQNLYWLSTAAALARWRFASRLVARADISPVADQPARSRVEAVASLLSVASWSSASAAALTRASTDPRAMVALALVSPEFVTN